MDANEQFFERNYSELSRYAVVFKQNDAAELTDFYVNGLLVKLALDYFDEQGYEIVSVSEAVLRFNPMQTLRS